VVGIAFGVEDTSFARFDNQAAAYTAERTDGRGDRAALGCAVSAKATLG